MYTRVKSISQAYKIRDREAEKINAMKYFEK